MSSEVIIGLLALITLCAIVIFAILSLDTNVLVPVFTTLVGYIVGSKKDSIAGYLGGKKLGHKR